MYDALVLLVLQFAGLWYEVERTQYHDAAADWAGTAGHRGKLWEAAVVHYDPVRMDVFNYSHSGYTPRYGCRTSPPPDSTVSKSADQVQNVWIGTLECF